MKASNIAMISYILINALAMVWLACSWVDIMLHDFTDMSYACWNIFTILFH